MTDTDAIAVLRRRAAQGNNFAGSLIQQWDIRGSLSPRQWPWVHTLANEQIEQEKQEEEDLKAVSDRIEMIGDEYAMDGIFNLFKAAGDKLKFPKVRLAVDDPAGVRQYKLAIAGPRSRNPGSVTITCRYGEEYLYLGRIATDGLFIPARQTNMANHPGLLERLVELASEPERVAREYGKLMGQCCFCGLGLTDERSIEAGFGPVCAANYDLNWGNKVRELVKV